MKSSTENLILIATFIMSNLLLLKWQQSINDQLLENKDGMSLHIKKQSRNIFLQG